MKLCNNCKVELISEDYDICSYCWVKSIEGLRMASRKPREASGCV